MFITSGSSGFNLSNKCQDFKTLPELCFISDIIVSSFLFHIYNKEVLDIIIYESFVRRHYSSYDSRLGERRVFINHQKHLSHLFDCFLSNISITTLGTMLTVFISVLAFSDHNSLINYYYKEVQEIDYTEDLTCPNLIELIGFVVDVNIEFVLSK